MTSGHTGVGTDTAAGAGDGRDSPGAGTGDSVLEDHSSAWVADALREHDELAALAAELPNPRDERLTPLRQVWETG